MNILGKVSKLTLSLIFFLKLNVVEEVFGLFTLVNVPKQQSKNTPLQVKDLYSKFYSSKNT